MDANAISNLASGVLAPSLSHLEPTLWLVANGGTFPGDGAHGLVATSTSSGRVDFDVAVKALRRLTEAGGELGQAVAKALSASHCLPLLKSGLAPGAETAVRIMTLRFINSSRLYASCAPQVDKAMRDDDLVVSAAAADVLASTALRDDQGASAVFSAISKGAASDSDDAVRLRWLSLAVRIAPQGGDAHLQAAAAAVASAVKDAEGDVLALLALFEIVGDFAENVPGGAAAMFETSSECMATLLAIAQNEPMLSDQAMRILASSFFATKGAVPPLEKLWPIVASSLPSVSGIKAAGVLCAASAAAVDAFLAVDGYNAFLRAAASADEQLRVAGLEALSTSLSPGTFSAARADQGREILGSDSVGALRLLVRTASGHPSVHVRCAAYDALATIASLQANWAVDLFLDNEGAARFLLERGQEQEKVGMEHRFCIADQLSKNEIFKQTASEDLLERIKHHLSIGPYRGPLQGTKPPDVVEAAM